MKRYLNLGCGTNIIKEKGWLNVDNFVEYSEKKDFSKSKYFLRADILKLPFDSDTFDYIIVDNVLEHIRTADVPVALFEIRRVLKVGGRAVIISPDFKSVIQQWLDADIDFGFNPLKYHFFSEVVYGSQVHKGEHHSTAVTPGYLHYVLNMVGLPKHEIIFYPAFGPLPDYPGCRAHPKEMILRNAELVADITK
jgi:SAM-dependent methyltransferase